MKNRMMRAGRVLAMLLILLLLLPIFGCWKDKLLSILALPTPDEGVSDTGALPIDPADKPAADIVLEMMDEAAASAFDTSSRLQADPAAGVLGGELFEFNFTIDGEFYHLPEVLRTYTNNGWSFTKGIRFDLHSYAANAYYAEEGSCLPDSLLYSEEERYIDLAKGDAVIRALAENMSGDQQYLTDCHVSRVRLDCSSDHEICLTRGFVLNGKTEAEIIEQYGEPSETQDLEDVRQLLYAPDYNGYVYENSCVIFLFSIEDASLLCVQAADYIVDVKTANNPGDTAYLANYKAPAALGTLPVSLNFRLLGELYTLPVPVSALLDDGWELVRGKDVGAGARGGLQMKKDGEIWSFQSANYSRRQVDAAHCVITGVSQDSVETCTPLVIAPDLQIGSTEDAVKKALASNEYSTYEDSTDNETTYSSSFSLNKTEPFTSYGTAYQYYVRITVSNETHRVTSLSISTEVCDYWAESLYAGPYTGSEVAFEEQAYQAPPVLRTKAYSQNTGDTNKFDKPGGTGAKRSQTIMIYVVASNLESDNPYAPAATLDLCEMMNASIPATDDVNVIVCCGGTTAWYMQGMDARSLYILELQNGSLGIVSQTSAQNMADPNMLMSFIDFAYGYYPADLYSLILWDHGGGPMGGYGYDTLFGDMLSMEEVASAIATSNLCLSGCKFEWIGFDACLMGSIEVAKLLSPYAEYLIASEETIPRYGWNYDFLSDIGSATNGAEAGYLIIDAYFDFYELYGFTDLTLSCMDLSKVGALSSDIEALFDLALADIDTDKGINVLRARAQAKSFAVFTSADSYDLVDLGDLMARLRRTYPNETEAVLQALDEVVVLNKTSVAGAYGTTCYFPYLNTVWRDAWISSYPRYSVSKSYTDYVTACDVGDMSDLAQSTVSAADQTAVSVDYVATWQLTQAQNASAVKVEYYVYRSPFKKGETPDKGKEELVFLLNCGSDVEVSDDGLITFDYAPKNLVVVDPQTGEYRDFYVREKANDEYGTKFFCHGVLFALRSSMSLYVEMQVVIDADHPTGALVGVIQGNQGQDLDELIQSGKQLIDLSTWGSIQIAKKCQLKTYTADGTLKPVTDWETPGYGALTEFRLSDGIPHVQIAAPMDEYAYYCMFKITLSSGEVIFTDEIPIN